jgi:hypothetical protein
MDDLEIGPGLVGQRVFNPARPEWGAGTVLRVETTRAGGAAQHRVSVQFLAGHKMVHVPPARLTRELQGQTREAGWLDKVAGTTADERLKKLPADVTEFLGTATQRLAAVAELYQYTEDPRSLTEWARRQTRVADPLSHWSRDELLRAFGTFCSERDAELRVTAARVKQSQGAEALQAAVDALPPAIRQGVRAALQRPI